MGIRSFLACLLAALSLAGPAEALPLAQSWSNTALISVDDDWSAVSGIVGYRGDGLTGEVGADPQAILVDGSGTPMDVLANQATPASLFAGGVAEFELADPAVALQPSGTADAPHLVLVVDTSGHGSIRVSYALRDLDASGDDAVQPVALQYRLGTAGDFVNVPSGFVADATRGPGLAELVTPVGATLPTDADDRPLVQVRIVTANAVGADEWVGVDDIAVTGSDARPPTLSVAAPARLKLRRALRRGMAARARVDEPAALRMELRISRRLSRRLGLRPVVGSATTTVAAPGTVRVVAAFRPRAARRLARLVSFRVFLRMRATDAAGNAAVVERRIALVR